MSINQSVNIFDTRRKHLFFVTSILYDTFDSESNNWKTNRQEPINLSIAFVLGNLSFFLYHLLESKVYYFLVVLGYSLWIKWK